MPIPQDPQPAALSDPNFVNEAGDVITEKLVLTNAAGKEWDLSGYCISMTLFEDLFSNVLMGEALISDSSNIISLLKIQGNEYLTFSYRTPSFEERITKSFFVTKISDRTFVSGDRQQAYMLSFISIEGIKDNNVVISKKYADTSENVIKKVFDEYLTGPRFVGGTQNTNINTTLAANSSDVTFVSPSWNPFKLINWCATRSFSNAGGAPNYMFFETNKSFYFASIEQLSRSQIDKGNVFAEYFYSPVAKMQYPDGKGAYTYTKPDISKQYNIVRTLKPFKTLDVLEGQDYGYYASRLFTQDIVLKEYRDYPYNHYDKFPTFKHLERNNAQTFHKSLGTSPDNLRSVRTKHYKVHEDSKDPLFEKWVPERNSMMYELGAVRLQIEVPGRTDIEVGKVVNFLYPKGADKTEGNDIADSFDPYLSGLYIITAIRHNFSLNKHTMYLEIVKDSYANKMSG